MSSSSNGTLLLIAFVCGISLHAQTSAPPAPVFLSGQTQSQSQYGGSISGHVYCADTSAPARFARVQLVPAHSGDEIGRGGLLQSQTLTGLDGSFQIQNVAPGAYYVVALLSGYLNPLTQVAIADLTSTDPAALERVAKVMTPVSVNGSDGAHTEIRLEHGASISGTVYYDDGSPAVNVAVSAKPATSNEATMGSVLTGIGMFARTDDFGRYRIIGLPQGDFTIMTSSQLVFGEFNGGGRGQQSATLILYAPKSFRAADAKVFTIKTAGELTGADVLIPLAAFHTVSGSVESSDGHALNAGALTLTDNKDKTHSFRSSADNNGQFRILYVPEGSYTLSLSGAAITEPSTTANTGNNRGRNRSTVVQSYSTVTQSVLVENGDLSVVVQAPPVAPTATATTPAPQP